MICSLPNNDLIFMIIGSTIFGFLMNQYLKILITFYSYNMTICIEISIHLDTIGYKFFKIHALQIEVATFPTNNFNKLYKFWK